MPKPLKMQDKQVVMVGYHKGDEDYVNKLLQQGYEIQSMEATKDFVLVYLIKEVKSK